MNGKISISCPSYGDGRQAISISIEDTASRIEFLEIEIPLAGFAEAITGLSSVPMTFETRGLEYVGLKRETQRFPVRVTLAQLMESGLSAYGGRDALSKYAKDHIKPPEGWKLLTYLGAQNSVQRDGNDFILNLSIQRFVPIEGGAA